MTESQKFILKQEREQDWRVTLREEIKAKDRTAIDRCNMPEEEPKKRSNCHIEVNKGLTEDQAVLEASRCLDCVKPTCIDGCPVGINIPKFIKQIENREFLKSAATIKNSNSFPAICGRVCPQEIQCEKECFFTQKLNKKAVAIGNLERFVADFEINSGVMYVPEIKESNNIKIAIIGSGPASLAVAGDLAKLGYKVTIFEALHEFGGVLKYGIPEFRLPNTIVDNEINTLRKMNVKFVKNFIVGKTASIDELKEEGYSAFFIGSGAGLPRFMNIPGENYIGVMSSNEYLTRVNLMNAFKEDYETPILSGKNVAVVGGGNTAMDSVRTAKRLGAERAIIIYRRSFDEMPARIEELKHAQEEGIEFLNLHNPLEYFADENGRVNKVKLQKMKLGEPDSSGRRRPIPMEGSEFEIEIDLAIISVGVSPNPLIPQSVKDLKTTKWNTIIVDDKNHSNVEGVFAGGDIVRGGATVILAMGDGKKAAQGIHDYLSNQILS